jgi:C-3',4' desaturase CrtD
MELQDTTPDIIVIGAGYAGLSFAAVMAQEGRRVTVLESHALIGGCASYFKRKGFHFEAGATTLSGLAPGRTLWRLTNLLGLRLPTTTLDLPMTITLNDGQILNRYRDHSAFLAELARVFPGHTHRELWQKLRRWEAELWKSLSASQNFPPKSLTDIIKLLRPKILKQAHLGALAFTPLTSKLNQKMLKDEQLIEFFNEQLMISTQSPSHEVPTLLAAMGMTYPEDMHYIYGGITKVAELLREKVKSHGCSVLTRHKVLGIQKRQDIFHLKVQQGREKEMQMSAPIVVSTVPIWNLARFFKDDEKLVKKFAVKKQSQKKAWGAIVANFGIKYDFPIDILYHQVHYKNHPLLGTGSLFFSFSHPEDRERAPQYHQAVTVSTHTAPTAWEQAYETDTYEQKKADVLEAILTVFNSRFGDKHEIIAQSLATPHTFEHYTQRDHGRVGGLAHNRDNNILTFPTQETPLKNFYRIGDTTFPGQGIVGVATGALILAGKLTGKNFLED